MQQRNARYPFMAALAIIGCTLGATLMTAPSLTRATAQSNSGPAANQPAAPKTFTPTATPPAPVFPSKAADPAAATLSTDPIPDAAGDALLRSQPLPRKTPIPFVRETLPDPDDRANTPMLPVTPEALPLMPKP